MRGPRAGRVAASLLVLVVAAGCSVVAPPVALRTAIAPSDICMMALMTGTLARNAETGLGVAGPDAQSVGVEWPFGYAAGNELGKLVLVDASGRVLAREGDEISLGGGLGADDVFIACGGVTVVKPGG